MRDRFLGVWKLISCESRNQATGEIRYPYGTSPVGRLTYDAEGRMSAILMKPDRLTDATDGFMAYFGTFDVDEAAQTVIHHVQASLNLDWVGVDLRRAYEFSGSDRLILTAAYETNVTRLVWQRDVA
jgi:hypothetical protein